MGKLLNYFQLFNENATKRYSAFKYSLLKSIIDNSNIIINGKNFPCC